MNDMTRTDLWLRRKYPGLTRRHIEEALLAGLVRSATGARMRKGDVIGAAAGPDCTELDQHLARIAAGNPALHMDVLFEDADVAVIDKPAGTPGHPVSLFETDTVTHWALARYPSIRSWARSCQPTVSPHRLDTGTSGAMLVARHEDAFTTWRRRFSAHEVSKRYLAWCWGEPEAEEFTVDLPLRHDPADRRRMITVPAATQPRSTRLFAAHSRVRVMRCDGERTLCEVITRTGVTHQVRVHLAARGLPLIGDELYDPRATERQFRPLHALLRAMEIRHGAFSVVAPDRAFIDLDDTGEAAPAQETER